FYVAESFAETICPVSENSVLQFAISGEFTAENSTLPNETKRLICVLRGSGWRCEPVERLKIRRYDPVWKGVINLYFLFQGDRNMYVYD
ncbi:hypothetical protein, partial [Staphylococcus aureus]|uniref:hypothetical protein n=1 Tax=Staphylococcus aureus TaxID=1280 RepID=UPI0038B3A1A9